MNDETLLKLIGLLAQSIEREGSAFSPELVLANAKLLVEVNAPPKPRSPVERHVNATEQHINELRIERDRLIRELAATRESHEIAHRELRRELAVVIESHRDRLDWFEPQYEGLKRDYDTIKALSYWSLVMITVGGVLIGAAGFILWDTWKFVALGAGVIASACGLWTQGLIVYKAPSSRERPGRRIE